MKDLKNLNITGIVGAIIGSLVTQYFVFPANYTATGGMVATICIGAVMGYELFDKLWKK